MSACSSPSPGTRRTAHPARPRRTCSRRGPTGVRPSPVFEPTPYVNNTIKMFEYLRAKLGFDVELIHDVHERMPPAQAIQLAKALEPFRPVLPRRLLRARGRGVVSASSFADLDSLGDGRVVRQSP